MTWGFNLFINIAPVTLVITVISIVVVFSYRKELVARSLILYLSLVCWLLITNVAELLAPAGFLTIFFSKLEYIAFLYMPLTWASFCMRYTGLVVHKKSNLIPAIISLPLCMLILVLTNEQHHFLWRNITFLTAEGMSVLHAEHGPLFWIIWTYSWGGFAFGTLLVIRSYLSGQALYQRQSLWILAGTIIPGITNIIYISRIFPGLAKDFTPIGFALSGVCFLAGMHFHRLFWIIPVSRNALLQNLKVGILVLDKHGWIIDHNQAADNLCELSEAVAGQDAGKYPMLIRLFEISGFTPGQKNNPYAAGHLVWKDKTLAWSQQQSGYRSEGVIFILEDVSTQVELQNEIDKIKTELINREKLAALGRLTAGVAHEINNPLGYLKSDLRSLERIIERDCVGLSEPSMQETTEIIGSITDGLDRIESVVRSLLSSSRHGTTESTPGLYDLNTGITTTLDIMKYEYRERIEVKKELSTIPLISVRKTEINQVLFNILTNAMQAIREKDTVPDFHGIITIRTGVFDSGNTQSVYCEIENNGPPIPPKIKDNIFDLFFTTKEENWGNGFGLNISRNIIEQHHGGKFILRSYNPVIFRFELPISPNR